MRSGVIYIIPLLFRLQVLITFDELAKLVCGNFVVGHVSLLL